MSGRLLETRKQLNNQKAQAYADFLKALAASARQDVSEETLSLAADAKTRICIYGARSVVRQLARFERTGAQIVTNESRTAVANLIGSMRRDMGSVGGEVSEDDLHNILFGVRE